MEIRLADRQGLLSQKSLNPFQRFAALYMIYLERRTSVEDIEDTLRKQAWYLVPERYNEIFWPSILGSGESTLLVTGQPEEVVDDIDEIDRYFDRLDEPRSLSGAELFDVMGDTAGGWV